MLEQKGVIVTLSTKGTYITEQTGKVLEATIDKKISEMKKLIEEIEKYGISKEEIIEKLTK